MLICVTDNSYAHMSSVKASVTDKLISVTHMFILMVSVTGSVTHTSYEACAL